MGKIILITGMHQSTDYFGSPKGKKELYVSHGVDYDTMRNVVLPFEPLTYFSGRKYDNDIMEWVLEDK